ncbi:hypothetical protein [Streptomyces sp. TS71-3]|uniref:hypothetical protein n=1 Tax=Streptomyces sp. TS71-3 TaxID=2733862 RepID=UPI001B0C1948|nr:hypothetical protein [Streptomyces sp. TS71-3]GHJ40109.1 hypothetical protein Sm713_57180 [Streptomyces sp. TS71-3]
MQDESGEGTGEGTPAPGKYARVERERRFLLARAPDEASATAVRLITDRYLTGTRLRLRRSERPDTGARELKLTQKIPAARRGAGAVQGLVTNMYLSEEEYRALAVLPAASLVKRRLSVPPFGIDVFAPPLHGLVLAEAEFTGDEEADAFVPSRRYVAEVTDDPRFTGGTLVRTPRADLLSWLAAYGIHPDTAPAPS